VPRFGFATWGAKVRAVARPFLGPPPRLSPRWGTKCPCPIKLPLPAPLPPPPQRGRTGPKLETNAEVPFKPPPPGPRPVRLAAQSWNARPQRHAPPEPRTKAPALGGAPRGEYEGHGARPPRRPAPPDGQGPWTRPDASCAESGGERGERPLPAPARLLHERGCLRAPAPVRKAELLGGPLEARESDVLTDPVQATAKARRREGEVRPHEAKGGLRPVFLAALRATDGRSLGLWLAPTYGGST
jgi:hypothetical protein